MCYGLAHVIASVSLNWAFTRSFTGAILLPIATQASTHITSSRQTLNLSLYFSLSSLHLRSLSLIYLVLPLLIFSSWILSDLPAPSGMLSPREVLSLEFGVVMMVTLIVAVVLHVFIGMAGLQLTSGQISPESDHTPTQYDDEEDEEDSLGGSSTRQRHNERGARRLVWAVGASMLVLYLIVVIVFFYHQ